MKMKKRIFNRLLKTGILLFGISLLLWKCEKHEHDFHNHIESSEFTIDYKHLEKEHIDPSILYSLNQELDLGILNKKLSGNSNLESYINFDQITQLFCLIQTKPIC